MAILGDYESSIAKFKGLFRIIHQYASRFDKYEQQSPASSSYAQPTASSGAKKRGQQAQSGSDQYLQEKWSQLKKDIKQEYDIVVQMHTNLFAMTDDEPNHEIYVVEGFEDKKKQNARVQSAFEKKKTSAVKQRGYADRYGNVNRSQ